MIRYKKCIEDLSKIQDIIIEDNYNRYLYDFTHSTTIISPV